MRKIFFTLVSVLIAAFAYGQCTWSTSFNNYPGGTQTTNSSSWTQVSSGIYAGEYATYEVVSGNTYEWSLCSTDGGSCSYDGYLTLFNATTNAAITYNDDACGISSGGKITWTATFSGNVNVLVTQYQCNTNSTNTTLVWRCSSCSSCPPLDFYNYDTEVRIEDMTSITCSDEFWITATEYDSISFPYHIKPGWSIVIDPTDNYSDTENSLWVYADNDTLGGFGSSAGDFTGYGYYGTVPSDRVWTVYMNGSQTDVIFSFEWCDSYGDGSFPYRIYDNTDQNNPVASGTFDHSGTGTNCFTVAMPDSVRGNARFWGPGIIYDALNGEAYFSAAAAYADAGVGPHTIYYSWDNELGCADTVSQTYIITPPEAEAGDNQTICFGESIQIGGSPTGTGGAGNFVYQWIEESGGNSSISADNIANPTVTPTTDTKYYVIVTDNNGSGCSVYDSVTVNVLELPTVDAGSYTSICNGESVTLTPTVGGYPTFTYEWTIDGNTVSGETQTVSPTADATYTLTVTDGNNCSNTDNTSIVVNDIPSITISASPNAVCNGSQTTLTAAGGNNYEWDNSLGTGTNKIVTPVYPSSTYTVTGTDGNNCSNTANISITVYALPNVDANADNTEICLNESVTLTGSGANSYTWTSPVNNGVAFQPTGTATYTVTGTDGHNCTNTDQITITVNPLPDAEVTASPQTICQNDTATLNATGGGTYSWNNSLGTGQSHEVSPLNETTYTVTVENSYNCTSTAQVTVGVNPTPDVSATASNDTVCFGNSTVLTASGAGSYTWSNGIGNGNNFAPGASATYTVTGTNSYGCHDTASVQVIVNPLPLAEAGVNQTIPFGTNTTLTGSENGGTSGPHSYNWSPVDSLVSANTQSPQTVNLHVTNTYTLTVTDDITGCFNTDQTIVFISGGPLSVNIESPDTSLCRGDSIMLVANGSGGDPVGYQYTWSSTPAYTLPNNDTIWVMPITDTQYTVELTDGFNTVTDQYDVTVFTLPNVNINVSDNEICLNDTTTLDASTSTGFGSLTYNWNSGAYNTDIINVWPVADMTYYLTITDEHGCKQTDAEIITVNGLPIANAGENDTICQGTDIVIDASGSSGNGLTYTWNSPIGTGVSHTVQPDITTDYFLTVTDNKGCEDYDDVRIKVNPLPGAPDLIDFSNNICAEKTQTYIISQAVGITYDWIVTGGTITNQTGNETTIEWGNTSPGSINISYENQNNCSDDTTVYIVINQNPVADAGNDTALCNGTSINLDATQTQEINNTDYSWNNSLSGQTPEISPSTNTDYILTVTDIVTGCYDSDTVSVTVYQLPTANAEAASEDLCEGESIAITGSNSTGNPANIISYEWNQGLGSGISHTVSPVTETSYTLTVTDENQCTDTDSVTISITPLPFAEAGENDTICEGSSVTISAVEDSGNIYIWDVGNGATQTVSPTTDTWYTVTVQYASGSNCYNTDSVLVVVNENPEVAISNSQEPLCYSSCNGSISINITGGSPDYTVNWSNGTNQETDLTELCAGNYAVTVIDDNACQSIFTHTLNQPDPIELNAETSHVNCYGGNDGAITLNPTGGTPNYTYIWENSSNTNNQAGNLSADRYSVTITDQNGCEVYFSQDITQPEEMLQSIIDSNIVSCHNGSDGEIHISIQGGTAPYTFEWNTGMQDSVLTNVGPGTYQVTYYDANNCMGENSVTLLNPNEINYAYSIDSVSCLENNDGAIEIEVTGGYEPYTFSWEDGETGKIRNDLIKGDYIMVFNDSRNCTITDTITINSYNQSCLEIPDAFTPNDDGTNELFEFKNMHLWENLTVKIYDRRGMLFYEANNYEANPWDGTRSGKDAPTGSYIYIIEFDDGRNPIQGIVTIIR